MATCCGVGSYGGLWEAVLGCGCVNWCWWKWSVELLAVVLCCYYGDLLCQRGEECIEG